MDGSARIGFMAVFAVSSSVAFLAHQANKRLISNFMKRIDFEFGTTYKKSEQQRAKKVRFVSLEGAPSICRSHEGAVKGELKVASKRNYDKSKYDYLPNPCFKQRNGEYVQFQHKVEGVIVAGKKEMRKTRNMPLNRVALYKGIIEQRMLFTRGSYGAPKVGSVPPKAKAKTKICL